MESLKEEAQMFQLIESTITQAHTNVLTMK